MIDQLIHQPLAQPLDIHRAARSEMQDGLLALRGAEQAGRTAAAASPSMRSTCDSHTGHASGMSKTCVSAGRLSISTRTTSGMTSPARRTTTVSPTRTSLRAHFVFVVQGSVGHCDTADEDRLQARHRRQRTGAPHLHADADHFGGRFLRRKLVRKGEARRARDEAEPSCCLRRFTL